MWKECSGIERAIILEVYKKPKSISDISKGLNKSIQTIGKTIERMENQDLILKIHNYKIDARKTEIELNKKRVNIEKSHMFYLKYYILIFISLISSGILSLIIRNSFLILGSVIIALPLFLIMLYEVYVKEDKIIVEKNIKERKSRVKKEVDNVD